MRGDERGSRAVSLWREPRPRALGPPLNGPVRADVAVVGAGITGLTVALLLQREGRSVVLVEADRVGAGTSGATSAHVTSVLDVSYRALRGRLGTDRAAVVVAGAEAAFNFVKSLAQSEVPCSFETWPAYRYTESQDAVGDLKAELEAADALGVPAAFTESVPVPFPARAGLLFPRQGAFDPMEYLVGLAELFTEKGGRLCERTRVMAFEEMNDSVVLETMGGLLTAAHTVLATHTPLGINLVQSEIAPYRSYVLAFRTGSPMPSGLFWDTEDPYHYLRSVRFQGQSVVLLGGEDHQTGKDDDPLDRYWRLEQFARERFREVEVIRRWSSQYYEPADGLPYIGRSPLGRRVFIGTGYSGTGLVLGTLAAQVIAEQVLDRPESPLAEVVRATRIPGPGAAGRATLTNLDTAVRFVADRVAGGEAALGEVGAGGGALVEIEGETLAVSRDGNGRLHALRAVCTHMGCIVHWNEAERTWDCPCHGGRFTPEGCVLSGPPLRDLESRPLPWEGVGSGPRGEHEKGPGREY
jgi:glycine/D-amino acid oxidase-like deaminating enzyme/nitrite reductase/ring-hydroxylating ferredoxin subunit